MIRLFLNQDFNKNGLIPDLENIKRYLESKNQTFESFQFADLAQLSGLNNWSSSGLAPSLIRCDFDFGSRFVSQVALAPENVRFNRNFDSLTFENTNWLPRLKYFDVLRRKFVTQFGKIEIQECAGIICDSESRYGLVSVLVSLGFRNILLFLPDENANIIEDLERYFIGINIKIIPFSGLTQNQDLTSVIINSVDLESHSTLMSDIAYFNFMTSNGIVVDLVSKTPIHPLLFEAEKAGLRTMKRLDVVSFYDYESLRALDPEAEKSKEDFLQNYLEIETID